MVRIGAGRDCLAETEGVLAGWFEKNACSAALLRPDHYVYGIARSPSELDRQLESMAAALCAEKERTCD